MAVYDLIRQAILDRMIVRAIYKGHGRLMCPHVLGMKRQRQHGLFYQFGGSSDTALGPVGSAQNWRCIALDELEDVSVEKGTWHTASDYSAERQTCVDKIHISVS